MPPASQGNDGWSGTGQAWAIISTLIAGMLVIGGVGSLIDRLVGDTEHVFLGAGFVVGAALGIYVVYLRYGRGDGGDGPT
jgi:F0F1-type ATP synthase assembly protein I